MKTFIVFAVGIYIGTAITLRAQKGELPVTPIDLILFPRTHVFEALYGSTNSVSATILTPKITENPLRIGVGFYIELSTD